MTLVHIDLSLPNGHPPLIHIYLPLIHRPRVDVDLSCSCHMHLPGIDSWTRGELFEYLPERIVPSCLLLP